MRWINDSKATNVESSLTGIAGLTFPATESLARSGDDSRRTSDSKDQGEQQDDSKRMPAGAVVLLGGIAKEIKSGFSQNGSGGLGFHLLARPLNTQRAVITVRTHCTVDARSPQVLPSARIMMICLLLLFSFSLENPELILPES